MTVPAASTRDTLHTDWRDAIAERDFERAWRAADRVLAMRDPRERDDPRRPYHERWVWDGRPIDGRHVLVRCYHGLGDTIQFARFLPALARRAASVTIEIQAPLVELLRPLAAGCLIPFVEAAPLPPAECDIEIMELAHALRVTAADLRTEVPYLPGEADTGCGRLSVGLCWQAGDWDPARSVPLRSLESLARLPGLRFVCLQRGAGLRDLVTSPLAFEGGIVTTTAATDTARQIAALDLVISVDTMVAHLAGAMGSAVWLLLRHTPDWRWSDRSDHSVWYPTARLFRQSVEGDWRGVISRISQALDEFVAGRETEKR